MDRWFCRLSILSVTLSSCGAPVEQRTPPSLFVGGTIAAAYGVTLGGVDYVPNDRMQSFGLVETCEAIDRGTCTDRSWSDEEVAAVSNAARIAGRISGFETSFDSKAPEVRVHARFTESASQGCLDGSSTCWFGSTDCIESGDVLRDANGATLLDPDGLSSWSPRACSRWMVEISVVNVYAWAEFLDLDRMHVLRSVIVHEAGHALGLKHDGAGIMRRLLPVCYFIDSGDARDAYDPTAPSDTPQRFECFEGVKEPELAPGQRAKLDAYQGDGLAWSVVYPRVPSGVSAWLGP